MKLSKKKKIRIKEILTKLVSIKELSYWEDKFLIKALDAIINCIETGSKRSLPEHKLYFAQCEFLSRHLPESILNLLGIKYATVTLIHELLKTHAGITSTSFGEMKQEEFNAYHSSSIEWIAMYLFRMNVETFDKWFNSES